MVKFAGKGMSIVLVFIMVVISFGSVSIAEDQVKDQVYVERRDAGIEGKDAGTMAADLLIVRPFSFLATVVGTAIFLVSLPISAAHGSTRVVFDKMVADPAKYTFQRSIGDL